ncbi:hypothetical protein LTR78_000894 [Recurvomyces mirabilis]|uniref:Uncharacterized protein n=1 Tax=Recurvomyces mirabilis TaxID=574656 RepID=A0AAE0WWT9_9PEZI|nr:hypothetical protein LTR78_000894 [Recurvomyces mirabilis]KAK5158865.1 hypothetical protein LTS14_002973 [Recurvomyces mirabilis]
MAQDVARQVQVQQNRAHETSGNERGIGLAVGWLVAAVGVPQASGRHGGPSAKALGKQAMREGEAGPSEPRAAKARGGSVLPASTKTRPALNLEGEAGQGNERTAGNTTLPASSIEQNRAPRDEAEDAGNDGEEPDAGVTEAQTAAAEGEGEDEEGQIGQWAAEEYAMAAGAIARSGLLAKQDPPSDS